MDEFTKAQVVVWISAIVLVGFCVIQAFLFLRVVLKFNNKHNIYSKSDIKECVKTGLVAVVGPGISTMFMGIAFMALLGSGFTFLRLGVIGSPQTELLVVQYAASAAEIDISQGLDASILTFMVFAGAVGCVSYLLGPIFTIRPIEALINRGEKKDKKSPVMGILFGASATTMIIMAIDFMMSGIANISGVIAGFLCGVLMFWLISKGLKQLSAWGLPIATAIGIAVAQIVSLIVG